MLKKAVLITAAFVVLMCSTAWSQQETLTRDEVLRQGQRSNEPYSLAIMEQADSASTKEEKTALLAHAIEISPKFPLLHFRMAWVKLPDVFGSFGSVLDGIKAYFNNFWWSTSLAGLVFMSLLGSFILALAIVLIIRLVLDLPLIAHDINENKAKFLLLLLALGTAVAGPLGFISGGVFLVSFYLKKSSKPFVYFSLWGIILFPVFLWGLDTIYYLPSPEVRAMVQVNEARENGFGLEVLKDSEEPNAKFSYALALKRTGRALDAITVFRELAEGDFDTRAYINLGNAYVAAEYREYAKQTYETALEELPGHAITLYNLSQVYRDELNYEVGDTYYDQAMKADRDMVSSFTPLQGKHYNRLVIDETLSGWELLGYALKHRVPILSTGLMPRWSVSAAAGAMLFLFFLMDKVIKNRAYRCRQCGKVVCARCSGEGRRGKLCKDCHEGHAKEDESPRARVARMLKSNEMKNRLMDRIRMLSFTLPGISQTYSRRALSGFFFLWGFFFAVLLLVLNTYFEAGLSGGSHWWLWAPAILFIIILYLVSISSTSRRLNRGWL